jgi:hypothetical protein
LDVTGLLQALLFEVAVVLLFEILKVVLLDEQDVVVAVGQRLAFVSCFLEVQKMYQVRVVAK